MRLSRPDSRASEDVGGEWQARARDPDRVSRARAVDVRRRVSCRLPLVQCSYQFKLRLMDVIKLCCTAVAQCVRPRPLVSCVPVERGGALVTVLTPTELLLT